MPINQLVPVSPNQGLTARPLICALRRPAFDPPVFSEPYDEGT